MREGDAIAVFVQEAQWGTNPGTGYTTLLLEESGLQLNDTIESVERVANASYPVLHEVTPVAQDVKATLKTKLYTDTIEDLLGMAVKRTLGELDSFTLGKEDAVGEHWHYGCKVNTATLEWSDKLLELTLEFIGREAEHKAGTAITEGSYPAGTVLKAARCGVSIAGVAVTAVQSGRLVISNNLEKGSPSGEDLIIDRLDPGMVRYDLNIKAKMSALSWESLAKTMTSGELTPFAAVLTFTGKVGETDKVTTCTFSSATLKAKDAPRDAADQAATVMIEIQATNIKTAPTWSWPA